MHSFSMYIAQDFNVYNYKVIQNILENRLDMLIEEEETDQEFPEHNNIRGKNYYK